MLSAEDCCDPDQMWIGQSPDNLKKTSIELGRADVGLLESNQPRPSSQTSNFFPGAILRSNGNLIQSCRVNELYLLVVHELNEMLRTKLAQCAANSFNCETEIICDIGTSHRNRDGVAWMSLPLDRPR